MADRTRCRSRRSTRGSARPLRVRPRPKSGRAARVAARRPPRSRPPAGRGAPAPRSKLRRNADRSGAAAAPDAADSRAPPGAARRQRRPRARGERRRRAGQALRSSPVSPPARALTARETSAAQRRSRAVRPAHAGPKASDGLVSRRGRSRGRSTPSPSDRVAGERASALPIAGEDLDAQALAVEQREALVLPIDHQIGGGREPAGVLSRNRQHAP